jgi:ABC-type multidrug transport system fused ATPase/permease subunit
MKNPAKPQIRTRLFDLNAWRYFGGFYKDQFPIIALASLASILQALLMLPIILLVRFAFDSVIPNHDIKRLVTIGFYILALNLLGAGIAIWVRHVNIQTIHSVIFRLREDLLLKLHSFSRQFYTSSDLKIVHARIVQETERLSNLSNTIISKLLPSLCLSLTLCVVLVFLNWKLFLVLLLLFPALFFLHQHIGRQLKNKAFAFQRAFEKFSRGISFTLRLMDLIRVQTAEQKEVERQTDLIQQLAATSSTMHFFYALNGQLNTLITGVSSVMIIILGGAAIATSTMSIGDLFAFYLALGYLYRHIATITDGFAQMVAGNASMATLCELAAFNQIQPHFGHRKIDFSGAISIEMVSFQYGKTPILKDISLRMTPGCKVAIVGDNGSGKTTLINLLLGFYKPSGGSIKADGIPYEDLDIVHIRKSMGVVMQNPLLFSGTIRENISFGNEEQTSEGIAIAAKFAAADDFVSALPDGYDTQIGEEGSLLSGGQAQKIAIARALLRRPKVLILDEPTAHLDNLSIGNFMALLDQIPDRPAILVVSHDMDIVSQADVIFKLENGKLNPLLN